MKNAKFFRNCPNCNKQIGYVNQRYFKESNIKGTWCISCAKLKNKPAIILYRNCPQCNKKIFYTEECNRKSADKIQRICRKCSYLNRNLSGANNPFYGRHHTEETKSKIKIALAKIIHTEEFLNTARANLAKVANKRPLYDIWLEKFGKEIADKKINEWKVKQSINNTGSKNKMFGKPSPQGSGNGWSGWYKEWFFRSLRELSFMILVIEARQLVWKVAPKIIYQDYKGNNRNYFPDFLINDNWLVEIKPKKLHKSPKVLAKKEAAQKYCRDIGIIYELIDPVMLTTDEIKNLYKNGLIKFLPKYDEKFKEKYLNV